MKAGRQPVLPSPGWEPEAPGKESDALFSAKGGRQPRMVAAKRPDEVVAPRHTALTCRGYPVIATILQFRTGRTTSSVCSLTFASTFPIPGKAYEVFLAASLKKPQFL